MLYGLPSTNYGKNAHVTATCYADTDYRKTIDYAERFTREHDCYSAWSNNCKTFAQDAATAGDEQEP